MKIIKKDKYGLVGKNISYSFSRAYFQNKFEKEHIEQTEYVNFDIQTIADFPLILANNANLKGLNVTIPYKEKVFQYLDYIDANAKEIGAVNTIKILSNFKLKGYNTDIYGFELALKLKLKKHHEKALILGSGGAAKAVKYVLNKLKIPFLEVSRNPKEKQITYATIDKDLLTEYTLVINTTPLGTFPAISLAPAIPYELITAKHYLFDLVYNPVKTQFLKNGEQQGATIQNGLKMLELQAEKAWKLWQEE
jgi:shikimate dehydrogenase